MMAVSYYIVAWNMFHKLIKNSNASNYTFMHDTRYLFNAQLKVQTTTVELTRLLHHMMLV
jgi:hypothetical protein